MVRTWSWCLGPLLLGTWLTGCVTITCDPDDPKFGKDCYECTRKATLDVRQVDPDKKSRLNAKDKEWIKDQTEACMRERGYIKQKQEGQP